MFPIPFNFPFRKKDGSITTMDDAISSGGGSYTLPTASATTKGGVKVGAGLAMDGETLKNTNPTPFSLPTASAETLGGVKVGSGLSIEDGVLSASGGGGGGLSYEDVTFSSPVTVSAGSWSSTGQVEAPASLIGKRIVSVQIIQSNLPSIIVCGILFNKDVVETGDWIKFAFYNLHSSSSGNVSKARIFYM